VHCLEFICIALDALIEYVNYYLCMTNMLLTFVVFSVDILSVGVASVSPAESV